jgi:hypothetical protein
VQELYASYAADPLAPGPRKATIGSSSSSNVGTPRAEAAASEASPKSPCFLERYVRQQAHIEKMLNEWQPPLAQVEAEENSVADAQEHRHAAARGAARDVEPLNMFSTLEEPLPLQVVAQTRNVMLDGDIVSCSSHTGGVRFSIPDDNDFRFCVRPLDPLETHPIFIGMVPAGGRRSEVTFLNDRTEGIFLRLGGYPAGREAIDGPPLNENDPLKPEFSVFGERCEANLPMPRPGTGIAIHFYEVFPRHVTITEKIQCLGCKMLMDNTEQFAEHCFEDADGHGDEFGFDSCRRVEIVQEGDFNCDPRLAQRFVRFQVENVVNGRQAEAFCAEPKTRSLSSGVPDLPRELPELVGGRAAFGPPGPWELCILLCTPGTRVQVCWLPKGSPSSPPQPTKIRPAAAGSKVQTGRSRN